MATKHAKAFLPFSLFILITAMAGCGSLAIQSLWKEKEIVIDARSEEWTSGTYIKEADCSFYARNDGNNLYLCLISANRDLGRRIMMNGLSLWIESDKEKDNRFGIRCPAGMPQGMREPGNRQFTGISGNSSDDSRGRREQNMNPDHDLGFSPVADEYELISKDGVLEGRYGFSEEGGIKIKAGVFQGRFIYEAKLPLKTKNAVMGEIAAGASSVIKLNFTLENIMRRREKENSRDRDYDVRGRVGMPEGETMEDAQGYGRGRGRGMNENQEMQSGKKFELKIDLTLASEGSN